MPSSPDSEPAAALDAVVTRYHRLERTASGGTALVVGLTAAGLILLLPLWQGILAAGVVFAGFRVPLFTTGGHARLRTSLSPTAIEQSFAGPRPPVLWLQWGIADEITPLERGARYEISYLFGLRSITMETTLTETPAAATDFELQVTAGDAPWGTYGVTLIQEADGTVIEIDVESDRRFALRGLPSWLIAQRYYDPTLAAQGYTVVSRERSLSLRRG
ncbi:MAG: hypothetical protein J07HN4v3_01844 [Halonotius sp. J07HN4]|nr:MAG: hypothetical protein J07HN4v3_01844 [Halonotius sp. J07HN4]